MVEKKCKKKALFFWQLIFSWGFILLHQQNLFPHLSQKSVKDKKRPSFYEDHHLVSLNSPEWGWVAMLFSFHLSHNSFVWDLFLFVEKYALEDIRFFQPPRFDTPFFSLSDLVKWIRQSTSSKQIAMLAKVKKLPNSDQHPLKLPSQGSEPQYFVLKFVVCFLIWSPESIKETDKIYSGCVKMASSMRFESGDKKKLVVSDPLPKETLWRWE